MVKQVTFENYNIRDAKGSGLELFVYFLLEWERFDMLISWGDDFVTFKEGVGCRGPVIFMEIRMCRSILYVSWFQTRVL